MTGGVLKQTSLQQLNVTDSNQTEQSKKDLIEAVKKKKSVKFLMDAQDPISAQASVDELEESKRKMVTKTMNATSIPIIFEKDTRPKFRKANSVVVETAQPTDDGHVTTEADIEDEQISKK